MPDAPPVPLVLAGLGLCWTTTASYAAADRRRRPAQGLDGDRGRRRQPTGDGPEGPHQPLRDRWAVTVENGPDLDVQGNVLDHEYTFTDGRTPVATVSKKWFRVADTYGVEIAPGQDPVLVLAATVAVDMMAHEGR
jgi:hypothetical protein